MRSAGARRCRTPHPDLGRGSGPHLDLRTPRRSAGTSKPPLDARHIEMKHLPAPMLQHHEHEQHPQGDRRHRKEINRDHMAEMVVKKRLPGLTRWPPESTENSGDGALGDLDAEHLQFAWSRGARHSGLAATIRSRRWRISMGVAGLPRRRWSTLDRFAQNLRKRSRCHSTTVSART